MLNGSLLGCYAAILIECAPCRCLPLWDIEKIMDIRHFFSKRLKTDDLLDPVPSTSSVPESISEQDVKLETEYSSDSLDIGLYIKREIDDETRFLLLSKSWRPDKNDNFKGDVALGKRTFTHEWLAK